MTSATFKGGIHPPEYKGKTEHLAIQRMSVPDKVYVPMVQHIGAPCKPLVKAGDLVLTGQKIGEIGGFVSAPVHASISGKVKRVTERDVVSGQTAVCVEIESDGEDKWVEGCDLNRKLEDLEPDQIIEIIKEAGITGLGGAGFPTYVKLLPPKDVKIDSVILNGAECEPFLTCDHRLMVEESAKVVDGLRALMKALKVTSGYVAIEDNKPDAIAKVKEATAGFDNIQVVSLQTKYPQGGEKQIISAVLGREVPSGKLSMYAGVVVNNVHTAVAVAEAVKTGRPLIERVLTVSGSGANKPQNLLVRIGTLMSDVIEYAGGVSEKTAKLVVSAPMTGFAQYHLDFPVEKRIAGIVAFLEGEVDLLPESPCIRCGRCVEACPIHLLPTKLDKLSRLKRYEEAAKYHILDCISCGTCTYVCPARRHLIHSIDIGKQEVRALMRG